MRRSDQGSVALRVGGRDGRLARASDEARLKSLRLPPTCLPVPRIGHSSACVEGVHIRFGGREGLIIRGKAPREVGNTGQLYELSSVATLASTFKRRPLARREVSAVYGAGI